MLPTYAQKSRGLEPAAEYRNLLGGLAVEIWHAHPQYVGLVSGAADTWRGAVRGTVLTAQSSTQRPAYAADGTDFRTQSVIQCARNTPSLNMRASGLSGFLLSGTRPWLFSVMRYRSLTGTSPLLIDMGTSVVGQIELFTGAAASWRYFMTPTTVSTSGAVLAVHAFSCWGDSTNKNLRVDGGTLTSVANSTALAADITDVVIGSAINTDVVKSDTSHWLHILCSAYPGAEIEAAVLALARRDAGF